MSRSKKNWDNLVNKEGNYIDFNDNKGSKGAPGKGQKGTKGKKGVKGEPLGIFSMKGVVPLYSDLFTSAVDPKAYGDVWLVEELNTLYVWTAAMGWVTFKEGIGSVAKGEKGEKGQEDKGQKGEKGVKGQKGQDGRRGAEGKEGVKGDKGPQGKGGNKGLKGEKGKLGNAFVYDDFTAEQLEDLKVKGDKGQKGQKGIDGDAFVYSDFTAEQLEGLKVKGEKGQKGELGERGPTGPAFIYEDFSPEQLVELQVKGQKGLKGQKGEDVKGEPGENLSFDDLTDAQKLEIEGDKGEKGDKGVKGQKGLDPEKGTKGNPGFGVTLRGSVETFDDLPETGQVDGDLWITDDDYHGYVWSTDQWVDIGTFEAPAGPKGDVGPQGPIGETGPVAMPVGSITAFASSVIPEGWLLCDGSAIPTDQTALIQLIGLNTPNLKGKFLGGAGGTGLDLGVSYNDSTRKPRNNSFTQSVDNRHKHTFDINKSNIVIGGGSHGHRINTQLFVNSDNKASNTGDKVNYTRSSYNSGSASVLNTEAGYGGHNHNLDLAISGVETDTQGAAATPVSSQNWDNFTRPHHYGVNFIIKTG